MSRFGEPRPRVAVQWGWSDNDWETPSRRQAATDAIWDTTNYDAGTADSIEAIVDNLLLEVFPDEENQWGVYDMDADAEIASGVGSSIEDAKAQAESHLASNRPTFRQAEYEDVEVFCEEQAGQLSNPVTYGEVCGEPFYAYDYDGTPLCQGHYDAIAQRAEMGWAGGPYGDYQQ